MSSGADLNISRLTNVDFVLRGIEAAARLMQHLSENKTDEKLEQVAEEQERRGMQHSIFEKATCWRMTGNFDATLT